MSGSKKAAVSARKSVRKIVPPKKFSPPRGVGGDGEFPPDLMEQRRDPVERAADGAMSHVMEDYNFYWKGAVEPKTKLPVWTVRWTDGEQIDKLIFANQRLLGEQVLRDRDGGKQIVRRVFAAHGIPLSEKNLLEKATYEQNGLKHRLFSKKRPNQSEDREAPSKRQATLVTPNKSVATAAPAKEPPRTRAPDKKRLGTVPPVQRAATKRASEGIPRIVDNSQTESLQQKFRATTDRVYQSEMQIQELRVRLSKTEELQQATANPVYPQSASKAMFVVVFVTLCNILFALHFHGPSIHPDGSVLLMTLVAAVVLGESMLRNLG